MINRLQRVFGTLLIAVGVLWSVQGAGFLHLKPILCFADCTELQDASGQWLAIGLGTIAAGVGFWYLARRREQKGRTVSK